MKPPVAVGLLLLLLIQRYIDVSKSLFKNVGQIPTLGGLRVYREALLIQNIMHKFMLNLFVLKLLCSNVKLFAQNYLEGIE